MRIKKNCIIVILLLIVTGCSNVKFLGTHLNKEEERINNEKINYLKSQFTDVNVSFKGRSQGTSSCRCVRSFIDVTCLEYDCDVVKGKYEWMYKVCSKKTNLFCVNANYDEVQEEWSIDQEKTFKYVNNVLDILEENSVDYYTYTSDNRNFVVMIKRTEYDTKLKNAIINIYNNYLLDDNEGAEGAEIVIFNEDDYNYLLKNYDNSNYVYGSDTLYTILASAKNTIFGATIEGREINNEMFNCRSNNYEYNTYELRIYNGSGKIWCEGFNSKRN